MPSGRIRTPTARSRRDMGNLFDNFRYEPGGATTLANSVCFFIREQIVFGRIKGGERLPTMNEISKATGLSFYQARGVVERLGHDNGVVGGQFLLVAADGGEERDESRESGGDDGKPAVHIFVFRWQIY